MAAASIALKPETLESKNWSSYPGGLCLIKILYKRSHFTKPARVSLARPPVRNNKRGHNNKPRRAGGLPLAVLCLRRLFRKEKQMAAAGFALKPETPETRNCSSYSGGLCLIKILYKRSHFTKPARVSLTRPPVRNNKRGHNNKPRRAGGLPLAVLCLRRLFRKQKQMAAAGFALKPETPESGNCSSYSGGLCLIKILYKRSHFTKPARVSLTRPPVRNNKRGHNNKPRRAGGLPLAVLCLRRLFRKEKQMAAAGFALKPETPETRNCSSYSGGLCLIKILYKRSHFTKPARVSLARPPVRNNKRGHNNKPRRAGGLPLAVLCLRRLFRKEKQMAAAGFALKPETPETRNCSSYSGGLCLIKILYKRSHFTKPARVSLARPPGRNNKRGHNNKPRRDGGSRQQCFA